MSQLFAIFFVVQIAFSNGFSIRPKIVNGELSNTRDFPFFVVIKEQPKLSPCSGTLISDRYVHILYSQNLFNIYGNVLNLVYVKVGFSQLPIASMITFHRFCFWACIKMVQPIQVYRSEKKTYMFTRCSPYCVECMTSVSTKLGTEASSQKY